MTCTVYDHRPTLTMRLHLVLAQNRLIQTLIDATTWFGSFTKSCIYIITYLYVCVYIYINKYIYIYMWIYKYMYNCKYIKICIIVNIYLRLPKCQNKFERKQGTETGCAGSQTWGWSIHKIKHSHDSHREKSFLFNQTCFCDQYYFGIYTSVQHQRWPLGETG